MTAKKDKEKGAKKEKMQGEETIDKAKQEEIAKELEQELEGVEKEKPEKKEKAEKLEEKPEAQEETQPQIPPARMQKPQAKYAVEEKDQVQVLMEGFDLGYANLLVEKLLEDKGVDFASADYVHPTQRTPLLKVKGKNVKKSIAEALKEVGKEVKSLSL